MSSAEAEQAWAHVHACHACRDHVEREGWVKARLAGLSGGIGAAPDHLRGTLHQLTPGERYAADRHADPRDLDTGARWQGRRTAAVVGSGAAGAAMLGVLALGIAPASTPTDRRPTGGTTQPVSTSVPSRPAGQVAVAVTGVTGGATSSPTAPTSLGTTTTPSRSASTTAPAP